MNGYRRLHFAAERNGTWKIGGKDFAGKMLNVQDFISDEYELFIQVTYCGYTVKGAKLWDFSDGIVTNAKNGVFFQQLTSDDRDKAGRIVDVLLGNSRRFF